jgi:hypothetical protein
VEEPAEEEPTPAKKASPAPVEEEPVQIEEAPEEAPEPEAPEVRNGPKHFYVGDSYDVSQSDLTVAVQKFFVDVPIALVDTPDDENEEKRPFKTDRAPLLIEEVPSVESPPSDVTEEEEDEDVEKPPLVQPPPSEETEEEEDAADQPSSLDSPEQDETISTDSRDMTDTPYDDLTRQATKPAEDDKPKPKKKKKQLAATVAVDEDTDEGAFTMPVKPRSVPDQDDDQPEDATSSATFKVSLTVVVIV